MATTFRREYLVRLPLPLAQLYSRAHNAKDARARHDNCYYLIESLIKLAACPLIACYLEDIGKGQPRVPALDRQLSRLAMPSLGQWNGILRSLSKHYAGIPEAAIHPLGRLGAQLATKRQDLPALLGPVPAHQERPRRQASR